jgi:hypothetical protein
MLLTPLGLALVGRTPGQAGTFALCYEGDMTIDELAVPSR